MEELRARLERDLECSICQEHLKQPATLPCQHTYCRECIQRHSDGSGNGITFTCPICRRDINVPDGNDFSKFPVSFLCNNMMETLAAVPREDREGQPLCGERFHENEPLRYYCKKCDRLICRDCIALRHNDHNDQVVTVNQAATEQKNILLQQKHFLEKKRAEIQTNLQQLEETEKQLNFSCSQAEDDIDRVATELYALIEQCISNAKLKVKEKRKEPALNIEIARIENNDLIQHVCDHLDNVTDADGLATWKILQLKNSIGDRTNHLLNCETVTNDVNPLICFQPNNIREMIFKDGLGTVTNSIYKADLCLAAESPIHALSTVNMVVEATVSGLSNKIELKFDPADQIKKLNLSERNGGGLDVMFTPKAPGELTIMAEISGNHIGNSPTKIRVEPQLMQVTGEYKVRGGVCIERPNDIAVNSEYTRVAIVDLSGHHCVYILDMEGEVMSRITGTGDEKLENPIRVAFMMNQDEIVVGDRYRDDKHLVRVFNYKTGKQVWSKALPLSKGITWAGLHVDKTGHVIASLNYIFNTTNNSIVVYDARGNQKQVINMHALIGYVCNPQCCITSSGFWVISDEENHCIHVINMKDTSERWKIGQRGGQDGELHTPGELAIDVDGNLLVSDWGNHRIQKFTLDGVFIGKTSKEIRDPNGIATLIDGRVMVYKGRRLLMVN